MSRLITTHLRLGFGDGEKQPFIQRQWQEEAGIPGPGRGATLVLFEPNQRRSPPSFRIIWSFICLPVAFQRDRRTNKHAAGRDRPRRKAGTPD